MTTETMGKTEAGRYGFVTGMAVGTMLLVIAAAVAFDLDFSVRLFHFAAALVLAVQGVALCLAAWCGWDFIVRS